MMKIGKSFNMYWNGKKVGTVKDIEATITQISWDQTWLLTYTARMYANEYRN